MTREHHIDWLRTISIISLIPFHVLAYYADTRFALKTTQVHPVLNYFYYFLEQWRLALLFLISGYCARLYLNKYPPKAFISDKIKRILVPLILGSLIVVPPQVYIEKVRFQVFQGSYLDFLPHLWDGIYPEGNRSWGHLWFLFYLFFYMVIYYFSHSKINQIKFKKSFLFNPLYTQFVWPKRFFISLMPMAFIMPFCDYKIHVGDTYTKSRLLSDIIGLIYNAITLLVIMMHFSVLTSLLIIIGSYHIAFYLDRLRETTEHNLMIDTQYGARNMGSSLMGMLVGGGPWGQPYHLSHHLEPALPWYFQISLHFKLKKILTPEQQKYYFINNSWDYLKLLKRVVQENFKFSKKIKVA